METAKIDDSLKNLIDFIPDKERLLVKKIKDFIDNDKNYGIALIAGMRHVGKTTVLKQLQKYYDNSSIIDFLDDADNAKNELVKFIRTPTSNVIFVDEITYLPDYENFCQNLYNYIGSGVGWRFKIIITGSSPSHICRLANEKLGGGRSILYHLPPITFVEYLYFTDKIASYAEYQTATASHFKDYLQLNGLAEGMSLTFDEKYFVNYADVNIQSNESSASSRAQNKLTKDDLINFANLLAYQLAEPAAYDKIRSPSIGENELQNLLITEHAQLIEFILASRIANIETAFENELDREVDEYSVNQMLKLSYNHSDLREFFTKVSVAIGSPLLYTRLGEDILQTVGLTMADLWKNPHNNALLGKMLEVYIRGALTHLETPLFAYSSIKLKYNGEVDVYKPKLGVSILCEVTAQRAPKPLDKINLLKYFPDIPMIRVCCTETHKDDLYGFHRIPYPQLCCMIDTGDILNLSKSTKADAGIPPSANNE